MLGYVHFIHENTSVIFCYPNYTKKFVEVKWDNEIASLCSLPSAGCFFVSSRGGLKENACGIFLASIVL